MAISKQNTEKLQTLTTLFIKDMGEEYFVKLLEVYTLLQGTLLNKEYVEELTEEKATSFVDKNKDILKYFDYFELDELRVFASKKVFFSLLTFELTKLWSFKINTKFITELKKETLKSGIIEEDYDKNYRTVINIQSEYKKTGYIPDKCKSVHYSIGFLNLKNFQDSKFQQIWDSKLGEPFNKLIIDFLDEDIKILENNIYSKYEYLNKIPAGIIFYHFSKWYSKEYIETVTINNYFPIRNVKLENFNSNEIYLLGENGVGKTILLQAILFALKGNLNSIAEEVKNENISFQKGKEVFEEKISFQKGKEVLEKNISFSVEPKNNKKHIYAYGVNRNTIASSNKKSENEYSTLFIGNAELLDPKSWLNKLYTFDLEEDTERREVVERINLKKVIKLLTLLFENKVLIEVTGDGVTFTEKETTSLELRQLSDGYKSVLIWVSDLIQRMSKEQPNITKLQDFRGVVLIDELDMFLHPKWAYKIMEKLRSWFPKVQFIISTHSPVLILGASKEAIFYKVYKENGETKVSEPITNIDKLRLDQIITDDIFDLESSRSPRITKLLNERTEILTKSKLSKNDEAKLLEIDVNLGNLPVGETKYQRKAHSVIDKLSEILKKSEGND